MITRVAGVILLGLAAIGLSGCSVRHLSLSYYDDPPPARVVHVQQVPVVVHEEPVYVCDYGDPDCYWDGVKVVVVKGHRHGPHCGHVWDGGHWVIVGGGARVHRVHPPAHVTRVRRLH